MDDILQTVIIIMVAVLLLFIFPLYIAYEKIDDISYSLALKYTNDFADTVTDNGYVTLGLYNDFVSKLNATGNIYDVQIEHGYVRYDPVDTEADSFTRTTEYFSKNHIINVMKQIGYYTMNIGDSFIVTVKNINKTGATVMFNIISMKNENDGSNTRIYVSSGGKVLAEMWKNIKDIDKIVYREI